MSTSFTSRLDSPDGEPSSTTETVLETLSDPVCRSILGALRIADEPLTANELGSECEFSLSTVYRKLETLTETSLVEESVQIRRVGKHTNQYETRLDECSVSLTPDGEFEVTLRRRE